MLGFIGMGHMTTAIARGVLASQLKHDIIMSRRDADAGASLAQTLGVTFEPANPALVDQVGNGGIVVVGVKPYAISEVLDEIREAAARNHTVIVSVAAGTLLDIMASHLAAGQPIVRVMPNVNSQIGAGMSALCANEHVTDEQLDAVREVFDAVGLTTIITEKDFPVFSAIAGCSPAWTFTYIDALSRGALAHGLPKREAVRIAAQAVMGSAQLVLESLSDTGPAALVDQVTSPGGTTIAGLVAMEKAGFSPAVITGVDAAVARDADLR